MVQGAFIKQVHLEKALKARLTRRTGMVAAAKKGAVEAGAGAEVMDVTEAEAVAGISVVPGPGLESEGGGVRAALDVDEGHRCLPDHEAEVAAETDEDDVLFHRGGEAWMTLHLKSETCGRSSACSFLNAFVRGTWKSFFHP